MVRPGNACLRRRPGTHRRTVSRTAAAQRLSPQPHRPDDLTVQHHRSHPNTIKHLAADRPTHQWWATSTSGRMIVLQYPGGCETRTDHSQISRNETWVLAATGGKFWCVGVVRWR